MTNVYSGFKGAVGCVATVEGETNILTLFKKLFMYTERNLIYPNGDVISEQRGLF